MKYPLSARILWVAAFLCWGAGYATICFKNFGSVYTLFGSLFLGGLCMIVAELIAATEEHL